MPNRPPDEAMGSADQELSPVWPRPREAVINLPFEVGRHIHLIEPR